MLRLLTAFGLMALALSFLAPAALAEEEKKEETPAIYADDEEAAEALKEFKTNFKAKGLKGDQKTAKKVWSVKQLAQVQHKKVADQLAKLMKDRNGDIKCSAVQYMGKQRALPGYAGQKIVAAMARNTNDSVFLISGLQAVQDLEYQGASEMLKDLMKHQDYAVQKAAMFAIGGLKDMRLLDEVYQLLREIKAAKGDKWDGVSVTYDTGTAGDHDQKMAEKIGKEKLAKNKAKARRGRGASGRDMGPVVEEVLKTLTGHEFESAKDAQDWMDENAEGITETQKALDEEAKAQNKAAKKLK